MTTRTHHGRTIRTSTRIRTTAKRAWDAWADPQQIANWFVDRAEGVAQPGKVMTWFFDTFNYRQPVTILEADTERTFVVGSGDAPGPSGLPYLMEIAIAKDAGDVVINLVNSGFSEDENADDQFEGVASGWDMALATMKRWLEQWPNSRRHHALVLVPADYTARTLHPFFATVEGRRQWLEPDVPADGEVLIDTGREVLLAWDARDAVLGLKAFRMGPQGMLALDFNCWSESEVDLDAVKASLDDALARLRPLASAT